MPSRVVLEPTSPRCGRSLGRTLLACVLGTSCAAPGVPSKPDVVLIVIDTLRADHLTQYGYSRATSVAIADFDADATRFTRAYSTSSWTVPSVASLLTGLLPVRHGVHRQSAAMPEELTTLAETLAAAGWLAAGFSGNVFVGKRTRFDQGFDHFSAPERGVLAYPDVRALFGEVRGWLHEHPRSSGPALLYLQPMNCHGPYRVPVERLSDLLGRPPSGRFHYQGSAMKAILKGDLTARAEVTPELLESLVDQYDAAVRYTVDAVGELLDQLRAEDRYDDSLIIVTADHGEELFDHGGFSHAYSLFEEVVRVPLWIKLPRQTEALVVDRPVSIADLAPTILDVAGALQPEESDGTSLLPLLERRGEPEGLARRSLVFDTRWKRRAVASAILLGRYKLIEVESDYAGRRNARLLYDVSGDPGERHDLASAQPATVEALSAELARLRKGRPPGREAEVVELEAEALEALGYVD